MLTGKSWTELLLRGRFQNGRREKMSQIKNGNFPISAHNYHRFTIFMSRYMFLRVTNTMEQVLSRLLNKKVVKIQDGRQFLTKFIICRSIIFHYISNIYSGRLKCCPGCYNISRLRICKVNGKILDVTSTPRPLAAAKKS